MEIVDLDRFLKLFFGLHNFRCTSDLLSELLSSPGRVVPFYPFGRLFWHFLETGKILFDEFYCYRNSFVLF